MWLIKVTRYFFLAFLLNVLSLVAVAQTFDWEHRFNGWLVGSELGESGHFYYSTRLYNSQQYDFAIQKIDSSKKSIWSDSIRMPLPGLISPYGRLTKNAVGGTRCEFWQLGIPSKELVLNYDSLGSLLYSDTNNIWIDDSFRTIDTLKRVWHFYNVTDVGIPPRNPVTIHGDTISSPKELVYITDRTNRLDTSFELVIGNIQAVHSIDSKVVVLSIFRDTIIVKRDTFINNIGGIDGIDDGGDLLITEFSLSGEIIKAEQFHVYAMYFNSVRFNEKRELHFIWRPDYNLLNSAGVKNGKLDNFNLSEYALGLYKYSPSIGLKELRQFPWNSVSHQIGNRLAGIYSYTLHQDKILVAGSAASINIAGIFFCWKQTIGLSHNTRFFGKCYYRN